MTRKNNLFFPKRTLNIRGQLHVLDRPLIMGILNVSPDSFYRPGNSQTTGTDPVSAVDRAGRLLQEGSDWLDIGGMSTRPGAVLISAAEDTDRVVPAIEAISTAFPGVVISVDTVHSATAEAAIRAGAGIINDVSAGRLNPALWNTAAVNRAPYVLMHHKGIPASKVSEDVANIGLEVFDFFQEYHLRCRQAGIKDIILDPGFGFGKSLNDNYRLLACLERLQALEAPVMVGVSRKSMISKVLKTDAAAALNGTTVVHTLALSQGATILRVHDPKEARETVELVSRYLQAEEQIAG